ncbi:MAG: hypothetical protein M3Y51_11530 [Actinomycetota bacterium]|nr:hypothetical protein [Actinomycetota bacterium]
MPRYFSCSWDDDTLAAHAEQISGGARPVVGHTSGVGFRDHGVGPGDLLYVLNWFEGELRVLGRMAVDGVVDDETARARLGTVDPAPEHVLEVGGTGTPIVLDAVLDDEELDELSFQSVDGSSMPTRNALGGVDPSSFDGVRELDADTADFFDRLLGFDVEQSFGEGPATRWIALLIELSDGGGEEDDDDEFGAQEETVVELELELQGWSVDVPERWVQIEHTVDEPEVLGDPAGVASLVEQLLGAWSDAEHVQLDMDQLRASLAELAAQDEIPLDEHDHDDHSGHDHD